MLQTDNHRRMVAGNISKGMLFLILSTVICSIADARSCGKPNLTGNYARAEYVFSAFVTSVNRPGSSHPDQVETTFKLDEYFIGRFEVIEVMKGNPSEIEFVYASQQDIPLEAGVEYIFFAEKDGYVGLCWGTARFKSSETREQRFRQYIDEIRALE